MVENNAGGFVFQIDDWARLGRFLVLGSEGGTYYTGERELTRDNAEAVIRCIVANGPRVVQEVVELSHSGRAPKNDPALFVLALAASLGSDETRRFALLNLSRVARTGTHLMTFAKYADSMRGWGRGLKRAIGDWYNEMDAEKLALQIVKYRSRAGWTHDDLLRVSHPKGKSSAHSALYAWIAKDEVTGDLPALIPAFIEMQAATDVKTVVELLEQNSDLPWETVPTELLKSPQVWEVLLPRMGLTALIRNLGRMSANGLIVPLSGASRTVANRLSSAMALTKARVHPIAVLSALLTYQSGHGVRGSLSWDPVREVVDALDSAFYLAFGNVRPVGKPMVLALDVSGSMGDGQVAGVPGLTPRIASAAMALVTARTERDYHLMAFGDEFHPIDISPRMRLDDVVRRISDLPFGGTDCALPMQWALERKVRTDGFVVLTDNETWAGGIHPCQALAEYRRTMGIAAKLAVVGMTATEFSIADPSDAGMLDVVGFDTAAPNIIADHIRA